MSSRRSFLQQSALAAAGTLLVPRFLHAQNSILENIATYGSPTNDKILIVVQFTGGNDGLNTVVPYADDVYHRSRPTIGIKNTDVIRLTDTLGWNPALAPLQPLWDAGNITIVNSVGYPNPDHSHFRSMDIWHTASDSREYRTTGWLGRYLDTYCKDCNLTTHALELDDALSLALKGATRNGFAAANPAKLQRTTKGKYIQALAAEQHAREHSTLDFLYKTLAETASSADYIAQQAKAAQSTTTYPNHDFGRDMKQVAELITAGTNTRVYYVSVGGFDTHVNQLERQKKLLQVFAEGIAALQTDLKAANCQDDVLTFAFSEFGRRVAENGSRGTDHGVANNIWLVGTKLRKAGFYNAPPDLAHLIEGDLPHTVDFRAVYASILRHWLGVDDTVITQTILGQHFEPFAVV